jgi:alpha-mannosidase
MKVVDLNETCTVKITEITENSAFRRMVYTFKHEENTVTAAVTLRNGSDVLDFDVTIDFKKTAVRDEMVPQISFVVPVSYKTAGRSLCEIPYGTLERDALAFDVPSHGSIGILGESKHIVALLADTKYGFRHFENEAQVTLVRNAYDPDPYSDTGIHHVRLGVAVCEPDGIDRRASALMHPLPYVSGEYHTGTLPLCGAPFALRSDARVSAVKGAEDGDGIVIRLYDPNGKANEATLTFKQPVRTATLTDSNEKPLASLTPNGNEITLAIPTRAVVTVKITF